jgi:hypothetical protein
MYGPSPTLMLTVSGPAGIDPDTPTSAVPVSFVLADQVARRPIFAFLLKSETVIHTWQLTAHRTEATRR